MTDFLKHKLTRGMALLLVAVLTLTLLPPSTVLAKDKGSDGPLLAGGDADNVGGFKYRYEIESEGGERDTYWGEGGEVTSTAMWIPLEYWLLFINDAFANTVLLRR